MINMLNNILHYHLNRNLTHNTDAHRKTKMGHVFNLKMLSENADDMMYYQCFNYVENQDFSLNLHIYIGVDEPNTIYPSIKIVPKLMAISQTNPNPPANNGGFKTVYATNVSILQAIKDANQKLNEQIETNPYLLKR